jgi:hypothetical protein
MGTRNGLRGRHGIQSQEPTLLEGVGLHPQELSFLLDLSADLKAAKYAEVEQQRLRERTLS